MEGKGKGRGNRSIKIDIGKSFDKLNLNDVDFIPQSIKNPYSHADEVLILSILPDSSIVIESINIDIVGFQSLSQAIAFT